MILWALIGIMAAGTCALVVILGAIVRAVREQTAAPRGPADPVPEAVPAAEAGWPGRAEQVRERPRHVSPDPVPALPAEEDPGPHRRGDWSTSLPAPQTTGGFTPPIDYVNDEMVRAAPRPAPPRPAPPPPEEPPRPTTAPRSHKPFRLPPAPDETPVERDDFVPVAVLDIFTFDDSEDR